MFCVAFSCSISRPERLTVKDKACRSAVLDGAPKRAYMLTESNTREWRRRKQASGPERRIIMAKEITFDIKEHLATFGEMKDSGWTKEANIVAWNGGVPKLDIREWSPDHSRMSKGVVLLESEAEALAKVLSARYAVRI